MDTRLQAGALRTALGERRDPLLGFCNTCSLVAVGALHLLCLVEGFRGHPDPAEMRKAVMEGTQDILVQGPQRLAGPSKTQKVSPLATDKKLRPRAVFGQRSFVLMKVNGWTM